MSGSLHPTGQTRLTAVSYAKNAEHERFLLGFDGQCRGRYLLAYLGGIGFLGGPELRGRIEKDLEGPRFDPEEMYPGQALVVMFDAAFRAGLSMTRLGELQVPSYWWSRPWKFRGRTAAEGLVAMESTHRKEATYGSIHTVLDARPGGARVFRVGHPGPCALYVGAVLGLFEAYGATGTVEEVACQWEGAPACCYEARWTDHARAGLNDRSSS